MERSALANHLHHRMTVADLRATIRALCEALDIPEPRLRILKLEDNYIGFYAPERKTIELDSTCGRNMRVLAHELAHYLHVGSQRLGEPDHSPRWVRIYFQLLDMFRIVPLAGMLAEARRYGVTVARKSRDPFLLVHNDLREDRRAA